MRWGADGMQFLLAVEWTCQWWAACVCPCRLVVGTGSALGSLTADGDLLGSQLLRRD